MLEMAEKALGPEYVFVVGCFRSGTTLLARILDASEDVSFIRCETRFLGGLLRPGVRQRIKKYGDLSSDATLRKLVREMYGDWKGRNLDCCEWLKRNVPEEVFLEHILESDRSERSIFKTVLGFHGAASRKEQVIVGEKTPSHVYHLNTLLDWFPDAKIIHILRDPRAVLVSQLNRRRGYVVPQFTEPPLKYLNWVFILLETAHVLVAWLLSAALHFKYLRVHSHNYYFVKYEDLIANPERVIRGTCGHLGIEFNSDMLNQDVRGSSFNVNYVGKKGFDLEAVDRWKLIIKPWMRWLVELSTRRYLKKFKYL
jgi:hypothetical protein